MTDWLTLLEDHWAWLVLAALLGIGEVLIPGVFLIWIAIAAAITGLAALALGLGAPAQADGDVTCNAGPQSGWAKMSKLKKKAWLEEWKLLKMQVEGDCYEVYARTKEGQSIEAFFHPVTLKKLVVFRRGQEIYRAEGFTG